MILAIDVGNTNIEFGVYDSAISIDGGARLIASFRMTTRHQITSDEIGLLIIQFLSAKQINPAQIDSACVVSVVPHVMHSLGSACVKYLGVTPRVFGADIKSPYKNLCKNPAEVGADRIVNAYSAFTKYGGDRPLLIVDFGTATTFDVCDVNGNYLGGLIYPGVKLSMEILSESAALLPKIELALPETVIGKDTVSGMQSGIFRGYAGVIKNIAEEIRSELGAEILTCIATGGFSAFIGNFVGIFTAIDKTLTLDGIVSLSNEK